MNTGNDRAQTSRMRLLCLGISLVCLARGAPPLEAGTAKLEIEPESPSFGVIDHALEKDLVLEATVYNRSDTPFDLRFARVGCGCMSVEVLSPGLVAPGESGQLRVTLDHDLVRVKTAKYPLTIMDGDKPVASAVVSYTYDPPVHAESSELFIDSEDVSGVTASTAVWVRRPGTGHGKPRIECDSPHFEATLAPGSEPGHYELQVACADDGPPVGSTEASVALYLPGSAKADLTVPVRCMIRPPVAAYPPAVLLKPLRRGDEVKRSLSLKSRKPFTVGTITASSPQVTVSAQVAGADVPDVDGMISRTYELTIRPPVAGDDAFEAEVRIEIAGTEPFEVVVPVVGEIIEHAD